MLPFNTQLTEGANNTEAVCDVLDMKRAKTLHKEVPRLSPSNLCD